MTKLGSLLRKIQRRKDIICSSEQLWLLNGSVSDITFGSGGVVPQEISQDVESTSSLPREQYILSERHCKEATNSSSPESFPASQIPENSMTTKRLTGNDHQPLDNDYRNETGKVNPTLCVNVNDCANGRRPQWNSHRLSRVEKLKAVSKKRARENRDPVSCSKDGKVCSLLNDDEQRQACVDECSREEGIHESKPKEYEIQAAELSTKNNNCDKVEADPHNNQSLMRAESRCLHLKENDESTCSIPYDCEASNGKSAVDNYISAPFVECRGQTEISIASQAIETSWKYEQIHEFLTEDAEELSMEDTIQPTPKYDPVNRPVALTFKSQNEALHACSHRETQISIQSFDKSDATEISSSSSSNVATESDPFNTMAYMHETRSDLSDDEALKSLLLSYYREIQFKFDMEEIQHFVIDCDADDDGFPIRGFPSNSYPISAVGSHPQQHTVDDLAVYHHEDILNQSFVQNTSDVEERGENDSIDRCLDTFPSMEKDELSFEEIGYVPGASNMVVDTGKFIPAEKHPVNEVKRIYKYDGMVAQNAGSLSDVQLIENQTTGSNSGSHDDSHRTLHSRSSVEHLQKESSMRHIFQEPGDVEMHGNASVADRLIEQSPSRQDHTFSTAFMTADSSDAETTRSSCTIERLIDKSSSSQQGTISPVLSNRCVGTTEVSVTRGQCISVPSLVNQTQENSTYGETSSPKSDSSERLQVVENQTRRSKTGDYKEAIRGEMQTLTTPSIKSESKSKEKRRVGSLIALFESNTRADKNATLSSFTSAVDGVNHLSNFSPPTVLHSHEVTLDQQGSSPSNGTSDKRMTNSLEAQGQNKKASRLPFVSSLMTNLYAIEEIDESVPDEADCTESHPTAGEETSQHQKAEMPLCTANKKVVDDNEIVDVHGRNRNFSWRKRVSDDDNKAKKTNYPRNTIISTEKKEDRTPIECLIVEKESNVETRNNSTLMRLDGKKIAYACEQSKVEESTECPDDEKSPHHSPAGYLSSNTVEKLTTKKPTSHGSYSSKYDNKVNSSHDWLSMNLENPITKVHTKPRCFQKDISADAKSSKTLKTPQQHGDHSVQPAADSTKPLASSLRSIERLFKHFDETEEEHHDERDAFSYHANEHSLRSVSDRTRSILVATDDALIQTALSSMPSDEEEDTDDVNNDTSHPTPGKSRSATKDVNCRVRVLYESQDRKPSDEKKHVSKATGTATIRANLRRKKMETHNTSDITAAALKISELAGSVSSYISANVGLVATKVTAHSTQTQVPQRTQFDQRRVQDKNMSASAYCDDSRNDTSSTESLDDSYKLEDVDNNSLTPTDEDSGETNLSTRDKRESESKDELLFGTNSQRRNCRLAKIRANWSLACTQRDRPAQEISEASNSKGQDNVAAVKNVTSENSLATGRSIGSRKSAFSTRLVVARDRLGRSSRNVTSDVSTRAALHNLSPMARMRQESIERRDERERSEPLYL